jgi:hypothetical protein
MKLNVQHNSTPPLRVHTLVTPESHLNDPHMSVKCKQPLALAVDVLPNPVIVNDKCSNFSKCNVLLRVCVCVYIWTCIPPLPNSHVFQRAHGTCFVIVSHGAHLLQFLIVYSSFLFFGPHTVSDLILKNLDLKISSHPPGA